jgi:O-antigen ligase
MDKKGALRTLYYLLVSTIIVSIYAVLERFGIDKNVWVQDVQNRVFSTLGQPNWLAAFLIALIPLTWANIIKKPFTYIMSTLFFISLLLTKSRSGLLGFIVADLVFWGFQLYKSRQKFVKEFVIFNSIFLVLFLVIKTPFNSEVAPVSSGPALETGGTESGAIRKIVWKGAISIWKHYPILGTGPETFAYSYYNFRPVEHNLVSEWDFIYNKAHNEYLNLMATTGSLGIISYLFLIGTSVLLFIKNSKFELLAGYTGLLVSNFFGFSVVPTQLILFLFPAFALSLND